MPQGPGTYGSQIGRPKKQQSGKKARKALAVQAASDSDLEEAVLYSIVDTYGRLGEMFALNEQWGDIVKGIVLGGGPAPGKAARRLAQGAGFPWGKLALGTAIAGAGIYGAKKYLKSRKEKKAAKA